MPFVYMSKILRIKSGADEKVHVTLETTQDEFLFLRGCLEDMHLFSEQNLDCSTRLVQRGRRESTKYFLLPKEHRRDVFPTPNVLSTKIESHGKHIFIFAVDKINIS